MDAWLFCAIALGIISLVAGSARGVFGGIWQSRGIGLFENVSAGFVGCVLLIDHLGHASAPGKMELVFFVGLAAFGLIVSGTVFCFRRRWLAFLLTGSYSRIQLANRVFILLSIIYLLDKVYVINNLERVESIASPKVYVQGKLSQITGKMGLSDLGREISLFRWQTPTVPIANSAHGSRARPNDRASWFYNSWGRDLLSANCHGYVFTGGEYLLWSDSVDLILQDNGYVLQEKPNEGDVIVYRDSEGLPVHSGIVSVILWDGTVLIESKWDLGSCFVHRVKKQPYSQNYAFYRSEREGHQIIVHTSASLKN